jgi:CubicO group peptidase (beta-lactamase class C family)
MVLKNGKIVIEEYFGQNLVNEPFAKNSSWYWASAGKSLTGCLIGIAQQDGLLDINRASSDYLGHEWSSMTVEQEERVKVIHHLTMTTGLDDRTVDVDCTAPECLTYLTEPGERWAYHNAPYTLTHQIISGASGETFDAYYNRVLRDKIGMEGSWIYLRSNHVYFSTARSMARFGLFILNKGKWDETQILSDQAFFNNMINTSQPHNESYGYLWWLNGKDSHQLPRVQFKIPRMLAPNAPADMYAAAGKNGQLLNIVPSKNIIVVRMGDNPDNSLVPTSYQDEMWEYLNEIGL